MNHMKQSKLRSQSDNIWFKKTNYTGDWLSEKSKKIIKQLNEKNMKNLLFTLLLPLMSFGQLEYTRALNFQNDIREFYELNKLEYDSLLAYSAQVWAENLAKINKLEFSVDDKGELLYYYEKRKGIELDDYLLDASINWVVVREDEATFNQTICENCKYIGFGIAENKDYIYVVERYDQIFR